MIHLSRVSTKINILDLSPASINTRKIFVDTFKILEIPAKTLKFLHIIWETYNIQLSRAISQNCFRNPFNHNVAQIWFGQLSEKYWKPLKNSVTYPKQLVLLILLRQSLAKKGYLRLTETTALSFGEKYGSKNTLKQDKKGKKKTLLHIQQTPRSIIESKVSYRLIKMLTWFYTETK